MKWRRNQVVAPGSRSLMGEQALAPMGSGCEFIKDLVSIIVPIYNVEDYVTDNLRSILDQSYPSIELVAIIDGSTDRSEAIVRRFAEQDPRVHVFVQQNAGLGAARNSGLAHVHGEYLWFIDADDVIVGDAVSQMVESLQNSNSDFAVCGYYRFDNQKRSNPGQWIMDAHATTESSVTLSERPQIICSIMACNKLYRTEFVISRKLRFPVGILWEDQAVSVEAYTQARSFDILSAQLYGWRIREDHSSITQRSHTAAELQGLLGALQGGINGLRGDGFGEVAKIRQLQVNSNDLLGLYADLVDADQDVWEVFSEALPELTKGLESEDWRAVPPRVGVLSWLIASGYMREAHLYIERHGLERNWFGSTWRHGRLLAEVPFWNDEELSIPDAVLEVTDRDLVVRHSIRRVLWNEDCSVLTLKGWVYIEGLDIAGKTSHIEVNLAQGNRRIPFTVTPIVDPLINEDTGSFVCDYSNCGFMASLPLSSIGSTADSEDFSCEIVYECSGIKRTFLAQSMNSWSSTYLNGVATSPDMIRLMVSQSQGNVMLTKSLPKFRVENLTSAQNRLCGDLYAASSAGQAPSKLIIQRISDRQIIADTEVVESGSGGWNFSIPIPDESVVGNNDLMVRVRTRNGHDFAPDYPHPPSESPVKIGDCLMVFRNRVGNLAISTVKTGTMAIDHLQVDEHHITLQGRALSQVHMEKFILTGMGLSIWSEIQWRGDMWICEVALRASIWKQPLLPLPSGRYLLRAIRQEQTGDGLTERSASLQFSHRIRALMPLRVELPKMRFRFELSPSQEAHVLIMPTIPVDGRGHRQQELLRSVATCRSGADLWNRTILMRSFSGKTASDDMLGMFRAIQEMNVNIKVLWAVLDYSVPVPEGVIPVVEGTRDWYEAMARARFQAHNDVQPSYFRKNPRQFIVQTMHGFPRKLAGVKQLERILASGTRVQNLIDRQRDWDYLVSPAPYASSFLREEFPGAQSVIEVGYPRNDVLFSSNWEGVRRRIRRQLGIPEGVKAVLYAPTKRDWLSHGDIKDQFSKVFDPFGLRDKLSPDYVILLRNHPLEGADFDKQKLGHKILKVSDYPSIQELFLASDIGVFDYSSLRFDYALTGKPMVFLVPDLDNYLSKRGSLFPYDDTAPGPWVKDTDDLAQQITHLGQVSSNYQRDRDNFVENYLPLEDGTAGERLIKLTVLANL